MHIKHSEHFTEFNYYYICFILLLLLLFYIQIFSYFRCKYVIKRSVQFSSIVRYFYIIVLPLWWIKMNIIVAVCGRNNVKGTIERDIV